MVKIWPRFEDWLWPTELRRIFKLMLARCSWHQFFVTVHRAGESVSPNRNGSKLICVLLDLGKLSKSDVDYIEVLLPSCEEKLNFDLRRRTYLLVSGAPQLAISLRRCMSEETAEWAPEW